MLQVEGKEGLALLRNKMAVSGPRVLYAGALGAAAAVAWPLIRDPRSRLAGVLAAVLVPVAAAGAAHRPAD